MRNQITVSKWHQRVLCDFSRRFAKACAVGCLLFFAVFCSAQSSGDTLRLVQTLPVRAALAASDNLSNIYIVTPDNSVEKYAPDGRRLARYSNNRLGRIARIDVSNPLKVLLWYADFRTAVFLDRSLTDLGELNLITAGYPEVRAITAAQDGNLWLYDEVNFRLVKITPEGEKRYESQSMNLNEPVPERPSCLREGNDRVWMADPRGVFSFDLFAQYDRLLSPLAPVMEFDLSDNRLCYLADNRIVMEHLLLPVSREITIPKAMLDVKTAVLSGGRLLMTGKETVEVFRY